MKSNLALYVLAALALVGCAFNQPLITDESHEQRITFTAATTNSPATAVTNNVTSIRRASAKTFALWPATSELGKQKLTAGKTLSIGTDGLSEKAEVGTNDVQLVNGVARILGR